MIGVKITMYLHDILVWLITFYFANFYLDIFSFCPLKLSGDYVLVGSCHSSQNSSEPRGGMIDEVIPIYIYTHTYVQLPVMFANHTGAVSAT